MIGALELVANKNTREAFDPIHKVGYQVGEACHRNGLIVRALGDTIALCPPLIATDDQIDEIFDRLGKSMDETLETVNKEGLLQE